ncbi:MAG: EAL domain-containing protein, partial [Pseudomonadota bacterium]
TNQAFQATICDAPLPLLLSDMLPQRFNPADLFALSPDAPALQFQLNWHGRPSCVSMRPLPWRHGRSYKLLECENTTRSVDMMAALHRAHDHDSATGLQLKGTFLRSVENHLQHLTEDQIALVCLLRIPGSTGAGSDDETRIEQTVTTSQSIEQEFGIRTALGRYSLDTISFFTVLSKDDASVRHGLRRLQKLAQAGFQSRHVALGAATFCPADEQATRHMTNDQQERRASSALSTPQTLLGNAELAIEQAQLGGRPLLYEPAMEKAASRWTALGSLMEGALATGVTNNPIETHFQPVIDPNNGRIKSFEALVRWPHTVHGYVPPPKIISMATESGLLTRLTEKVLEDALEQTKIWPNDISFAVNVTPSQLTNDLVDLVRRKVREHAIDPRRLEIEITEEALIEDFDLSARIVDRLRAIGVGVAMDDFGAGYTSLSNLRHLSFTRIKIDKSISDGLPTDARSTAIVRSIMYLARQLDVDVTVEGIETAKQLAFLQAFDCGVQGYVFSKPLPPDHLPDLARFLTPNTWECGQPPVDTSAGNVIGMALGRANLRGKS